MKFTVAFITILSISSSLAVLAKEETKDKREASPGYALSAGQSSGSSGHSSGSSGHSPSYSTQGHGDASSISIGAGYSIGGAKPSLYSAQGSSGAQYQSDGSPGNGHATIQLAPITLQPNHGIVGTDLSQIMSQLSHSLNSGALTLQPSNTVAEFHESSHGQGAQGGQGIQELSAFPQFSYASPKFQQYAFPGSIGSAPAYSAGTKGLSTYSSTGPVLFNPSNSQGNSAALKYSSPSAGQSYGSHQALDASSLGGHSLAGLSFGGSGHSLSGPEVSLGSPAYSLGGLAQSLGAAGHSFGNSGHALGNAGYSLGDAGHSLGGASLSYGDAGQLLSGAGHALGDSGHSLGGAGHSFGGAGHSLGGAGHSLGDSFYALGGGSHSLGSAGHSFGGAGHSLSGSPSPQGAYYKVSAGSHGHGPSKSAFKPSTFLGASVQSDSGHSGSHGIPSFSGSLSGHGPSFGGSYGSGGSSKLLSPIYTKTSGHGSSLDSAAAFSSAGHAAPGSAYAFSSNYPGSSSSLYGASSGNPQFYISSSKYPSSFGEGSSSYKSPSSHGSLSSIGSHSSGPKYSFGSSGSRHGSAKDSHGAYSDTIYNTIKYSEELKPRA